MKITYLGQNCLYIETAGQRLLIDPAISINPLAASISLLDLPVDYLLITHGHGDHVADAAEVIKQHQPTIISNYELTMYFAEIGGSAQPMNHGGRKDFPFGELALVNAIHSSVLPDGTYGGNPVGFVLSNEEGCIYIAGDTALTYDMKLIPELYPPIDLAILPIGDNFTMGARDATLASQFVKAKRVMGCHFDTFGLIRIDHSNTQEVFASAGIDFILPTVGEEISL